MSRMVRADADDFRLWRDRLRMAATNPADRRWKARKNGHCDILVTQKRRLSEVTQAAFLAGAAAVLFGGGGTSTVRFFLPTASVL